MKKNVLKILGTLFIATLFFTSCKKETKEINYDFGFHQDGCRLLSSSSEFGNYTYTYNQKGLLDEYIVPYYEGSFKMEYNSRGQIIKSRLYAGGVLVNTIIFFYHDDHVVKETWYDGDTQTKVDEVFYTYNRNGKASQSKSYIQDYSSAYTYTPDGNISEWDLYISGNISYTQQFTFLPPHHKDPYLAVPGLVYDFTAINGWFVANKWFSTSEKDISYDENGMNPVVLLDQDPDKTIVQFNKHNYLTESDYFDNITQTYVHFMFDYENCGSDDGDKTSSTSKSQGVSNGKMTLGKFLRIGSSKPIKDQLKEFRMQNLNKN